MTVETRERIGESEVRVKTIPDVLRHAALIIEERGWWGALRGASRESNCAWQAIVVADGGPDGDELLAEAACSQLLRYVDGPDRDRYGPLGNGIALWAWNDTPGRTAAEVTAALRAAADAYEATR